MRFQYSTTSPIQNEFDSLPRLTLLLHRADRRIEGVGLVDSGATVNVLPYELGLQLGGVWDDRKAILTLKGCYVRTDLNACRNKSTFSRSSNNLAAIMRQIKMSKSI
jgi:hypothetical protein